MTETSRGEAALDRLMSAAAGRALRRASERMAAEAERNLTPYDAKPGSYAAFKSSTPESVMLQRRSDAFAAAAEVFESESKA